MYRDSSIFYNCITYNFGWINPQFPIIYETARMMDNYLVDDM